MSAPNIILFGESGSGKSSIVNMLSNSTVAKTSSSATGCTFDSKSYLIHLRGKKFNIYDTAGLDEGKEGTVPTTDAIVQLFNLLKSLESGLNLLVFCMRGPRIRDASHKNWSLFHEIICQRKVPIVMAVTGLEDEEDMDEWWISNKWAFQRFEIFPQEVACITATKGKKLKNGWRYQEEFEESKLKMENILRRHCLDNPWKVAPVEWFATVVDEWWEHKACHSPQRHTQVREVAGLGIQQLMSRCGMTEENAKMLVAKLS